MNEYVNYIKRCLNLAKKGEGFVDPNPLVGAVIVKNGKIIGTGYHKAFGKPHAEREALKKCKENPKGATMYVNLEPCCHYGKTPPCTDAIIHAGIKEVVACNKDPNPKVHKKSQLKLQKAGIKVVTGILEKEGKELNKAYFKWITKKSPYVSIKLAMSSNGMIAHGNKKPIKITGKRADKEAHEMRNKNQAILVGINTVLNDNPKLTCRLKKKNRNPLRIIVDSKLRSPRTAKIFQDDNFLIATTKKATKKKLQQWNKKNIWISPTKKSVDIKKLLKHLASINIASVLVEGGKKIIESFLDKNLADEITIYMAPKIIKNGLRWSDKKLKKKLTSVNFEKIGTDTALKGKFKID